MNPTFEQLAEFHEQVKAGRITRANFQAFIRNPSLVFQGGFPVSYDQSIGLVPLIEGAVGQANLGNINRDITQERYKLAGTGVRQVKAKVEPYLDGETPEQAYDRLNGTVAGFGNTGDLAGSLRDHPDEVEKWSWVDAISEDSRWAYPDGCVLVPYALVLGTCRGFSLDDFRHQRDSRSGVLVLCESSGT